MITQLLKRRSASDTVLDRIVQALFGIVGCVIPVVGFRKLPELQLTEPQLLLGVGVILLLFLQCWMFYLLIDLKRNIAQPNRST